MSHAPRHRRAACALTALVWLGLAWPGLPAWAEPAAVAAPVPAGQTEEAPAADPSPTGCSQARLLPRRRGGPQGGQARPLPGAGRRPRRPSPVPLSALPGADPEPGRPHPGRGRGLPRRLPRQPPRRAAAGDLAQAPGRRRALGRGGAASSPGRDRRARMQLPPGPAGHRGPRPGPGRDRTPVAWRRTRRGGLRPGLRRLVRGGGADPDPGLACHRGCPDRQSTQAGQGAGALPAGGGRDLSGPVARSPPRPGQGRRPGHLRRRPPPARPPDRHGPGASGGALAGGRRRGLGAAAHQPAGDGRRGGGCGCRHRAGTGGGRGPRGAGLPGSGPGKRRQPGVPGASIAGGPQARRLGPGGRLGGAHARGRRQDRPLALLAGPRRGGPGPPGRRRGPVPPGGGGPQPLGSACGRASRRPVPTRPQADPRRSRAHGPPPGQPGPGPDPRPARPGAHPGHAPGVGQAHRRLGSRRSPGRGPRSPRTSTGRTRPSAPWPPAATGTTWPCASPWATAPRSAPRQASTPCRRPGSMRSCGRRAPSTRAPVPRPAPSG